MIKRFTTLLLIFSSSVLWAQESVSPELKAVSITGGKTPSETAVTIGKQFLGYPYVSHTLDASPTEQLVVNLREFDCTTYLETVLALSLAWHDQIEKTNLASLDQSFRNYLTKLRYRDGRIEGYASRLHYFSDWLRDNERKGLLMDVTRELTGSISVAKPVSYMTTATYKYPRLTDPEIFKQVALAEASISQQSFYFIPTKNIRQAEAQLREGDIIMLTAARPGLDMKHVGLAVKHPDGRIHLLHASSDQAAVVITSYSLSEYVQGHKRLSGIRVARLRPTRDLATAAVETN
ncbi:N-acetylmuramoyl-L-alanine amidase-like domain-containing protein [Spirosoma oryzicola]|uniref:N-acetylmuramoyl-L-alanine amidase-like domain-containing protein n=1 Tax=Spirosoma oryzicola TaxID=2898794 RepID=UPI001E5078F6|nr:N-acetylmuramoyl-L-alanine amidase-like domain-containing protein [Spirosoma oryzicola]UHG89741.1 DUF1460 domain-containing protein [Spirosoma oryzicola]